MGDAEVCAATLWEVVKCFYFLAISYASESRSGVVHLSPKPGRPPTRMELFQSVRIGWEKDVSTNTYTGTTG